MSSDQPISPDFPFASRYVEVLGSRMHYIEEGTGDPVLFLHGNPTSSYLWRNIIPHLSPRARCLAPDLIGMGRSDKPGLAYRFFDHYRYLEGFIQAMRLSSITLVVHDWGSGLGLHYASRNEGNVRGIALMEAIVRPFRWEQFPREFKLGFKLMRTPLIGGLLLSGLNIFVKQILPQSVIRPLSAQEKRRYEEPFPTVRSRRPVRRWPLEIPINGKPVDMHEVVSAYSRWLQQSSLPKLLFYGRPGGIIGAENLEWCRQNITNLETVDIGPGIHFLQEDNPHLIGEKLAEWYTQAVSRKTPPRA